MAMEIPEIQKTPRTREQAMENLFNAWKEWDNNIRPKREGKLAEIAEFRKKSLILLNKLLIQREDVKSDEVTALHNEIEAIAKPLREEEKKWLEKYGISVEEDPHTKQFLPVDNSFSPPLTLLNNSIIGWMGTAKTTYVPIRERRKNVAEHVKPNDRYL